MRFHTRLTSCLLISLLALAASAQEITGSFVGRVQDPSGAVISGATIKIENTDKNVVVRTVTSDASGEYAAPLLPIGNYSLIAAAPGFQTSIKKVMLNVNDKLTINFSLRVGVVAEEIVVSVSDLQVELQSNTAAGLISGTQVRELSLNNRNYEQLVALQPGVSYGGGDQLYVGVMNPNGEDNSVNFAINGARPNANNWTIDGTDNVDRGSNATLLNYPSVDAIAEFKVLRGMYNPEFGRAAGGQVNIITKSGDSAFHGSLYEFFRNDVLNANNFFNNLYEVAKPPLRYNNFGGTIGGPIFIPGKYNTQKNKTFFFFSEEVRRITTSATSSPAILPTADELQGNFANPVCVAFDAEGNCTQVGTAIAPSTFNPAATAYISDIFSKLPQASIVDSVRQGVVSPLRNVYNYRQDMIRVDHVFGPKLNLSVRYMHDSIPTEEPTGLWTGINVPFFATTSTNAPGHNFMVRGTATFSPTFMLDAGYAYSYGAIVSRPIGLASNTNSPDIVNAITLPNPSTLGRVPSVSFEGGETLTAWGKYDDFNRNHNWFANLTKIVGHHTLKFGGTINRYNKYENAGDGNQGSFTFGYEGLPAENLSETGQFEQSWANFLLGRAKDFSQTSKDLLADIHQNQFEWYVQDEYRVRPNLTLSYGVRHSLFRQPTDGNGRLTNFDPRLYDPAKAPVIDADGNIVPDGNPNYDPLNGLIVGGQNSPYGTAVARQVNNNFAPRLGIAWDPFRTGKTAVRAGYGIFYDSPTVGFVEDNAWVNPPFAYGLSIYNTSFSNPGEAQAAANLAPPYLRVADVNWHTPYTQQWSLDVQHQISNGFVVDVGYYGNKGTHLLGDIDINQVYPGVAVAAGLVPPEGVSDPSTLNSVRPYKGYGWIDSVSSLFSSNYHSLQASAQKQFAGNALINLAYTWSKNLTDHPSDRWDSPQNTYDIRANYGPSYLDRKHIFTANFVYPLPWLKEQQGLAGHVLGGWEFSGIIAYNSGTSSTVTSGQWLDHAGNGFLAGWYVSQLPDMWGNPNRGVPHTMEQWFNTSVFADVPDGEYRLGNERRNSVRGPGFGRWDLSMFKNLKLTERTKLQFRAEAFNIWNHTNYSGIDTAMDSSFYGQVVSTRDPRNIQFGLKLLF